MSRLYPDVRYLPTRDHQVAKDRQSLAVELGTPTNTKGSHEAESQVSSCISQMAVRESSRAKSGNRPS